MAAMVEMISPRPSVAAVVGLVSVVGVGEYWGGEKFSVKIGVREHMGLKEEDEICGVNGFSMFTPRLFVVGITVLWVEDGICGGVEKESDWWGV